MLTIDFLPWWDTLAFGLHRIGSSLDRNSHLRFPCLLYDSLQSYHRPSSKWSEHHGHLIAWWWALMPWGPFFLNKINTQEQSTSGRLHILSWFHSVFDERVHRVMLVSNLANVLTFMVREDPYLSPHFWNISPCSPSLVEWTLFVSPFHQIW